MDVVHDVPTRLGRYEIVERLAAGGMGEVFVARTFGSGGFVKAVALKRIHPHLAQNDAFIHMLHDEANVAGAVRHPNIVATIDVGHDGDNHFVVLDYVSGDPLSRILRELKRRRAHMPTSLVAFIGAQVASALHAAHEAKNLTGQRLDIVHRDVSLANVMLSDAGHAMLFDFGVAKAAQRIHQTSAGELKGKLCYMAPETFHGVPVDRTVDVFSLGVVLYELLTAKSPFQRDSDLETISALQRAVVPPPSQLRKEVDPALDAIVGRAMARERNDRYRTAAEVEHALRDWARATGAPHDAGFVEAWLQSTFPERIQARRSLLARVADPREEITVVGGSPLSAREGGTPVSGPISGSSYRGGKTPLSGRISAPGGANTPMSVRGGTQIMPGSSPSTPSTVDGIARRTSSDVSSATYPAPPRRRWVPLAGALLGAAVAIAAMVTLMGQKALTDGSQRAGPETPAAAGPVVAAQPPAAPPPVATDEPAAVAPTATATPTSPSPAAPPAHAAAPLRKPREAAKPAAKGKGPLVRTYDP